MTGIIITNKIKPIYDFHVPSQKEINELIKQHIHLQNAPDEQVKIDNAPKLLTSSPNTKLKQQKVANDCPICKPGNLFDVDKYHPQEVDDDWFEVIPKPISVKNRHLINITKPIGITTIGSVLPLPKFVISPWLSIEPDVDLKPLF